MVRVEGSNEAHVIRTLLEFGQEIRYRVAGLPTGLKLKFLTLVGAQ
jgi:hypothetical protein